ncbi:hypothetical protein AB0F43_20990 [Kribbella sp. NPDC023972]|uniref:hypothetical protein n=1 Tax=Kribbella sp. NPDC023972 TaxID=3154795 RepID=UPI0033C155AE
MNVLSAPLRDSAIVDHGITVDEVRRRTASRIPAHTGRGLMALPVPEVVRALDEAGRVDHAAESAARITPV